MERKRAYRWGVCGLFQYLGDYYLKGRLGQVAEMLSDVVLLTVVCRATVLRGNGAGSAAHYFVGTGAWGTG
jgi:hypothetical protein